MKLSKAQTKFIQGTINIKGDLNIEGHFSNTPGKFLGSKILRTLFNYRRENASHTGRHSNIGCGLGENFKAEDII